jgi:Uma2 family endonuclease
MATLIESPPKPLSIRDVAAISHQLADDLSRMVLKTEGFSVEDYLSLDGPYFVELTHGCLQILPMPDALHQAIAFVFANLLVEWSASDPLARTKLAPFRLAINKTEFREPDVCFMLGRNAARRHSNYWDGADLVVEVISESNRDHDRITKRAEYAAAGIPEYWIIEPELRTILVLTLRDGTYVQHGTFSPGQVATSVLLSGFSVDVANLFARAAAQA